MQHRVMRYRPIAGVLLCEGTTYTGGEGYSKVRANYARVLCVEVCRIDRQKEAHTRRA